MAGKVITPVEVRFWSKVDCSNVDGCWLWQAGCYHDGYGRFSIRDYETRAHRVAWELTNGPIQSGLFVLHHCDVPSCVRPDHLFLGTALDNSLDAWKKKRNYFQTTINPSTKLTAVQTRTIRRLRKVGTPLKDLAKRFSVAESTISRIAHRTRRVDVK